MKKIERKSRVLKIDRETVLHLTADSLRQVIGGSARTQCESCHGGGTTTTSIHTQNNEDNDHQ